MDKNLIFFIIIILFLITCMYANIFLDRDDLSRNITNFLVPARTFLPIAT